MNSSLFRSTGFRIAVMFVVLFASAMIAGFLVVYWQAGRLLDRRLDDRLMETRDILLVVSTRGGVAALRNVIQGEAGTIRDSDTILLLTGPDGQYLAGNVRGIPEFADTRSIPRQSIPEMAARAAYNDRYVSRWTAIEGGHLLVGVSDRDLEATRNVFLAGLGLGLTAMLAIAGFSGLWLARSTQRRVDAFATTLQGVAFGRLDQRVRLSGRGDDLDRIGEQLNLALDRLQLLIERVNQSASAIAHELRSPIGRIRQKLERLLDSPMGGGEQADALSAAVAEIDSVVEIVNAILRIGQIQAGAGRERMVAVDVTTLLAEVAEVYQPVAEESGKSIVCLAGMPPAVVRGDRQLLTQMFANLIENSLRHATSADKIELSIETGPDGATVRVADNGPGIPLSQRQLVLEPFARLDASRSTSGAGLGLSLVKAIAEFHSARLELDGNDQGLTVIVYFPPSAGAP